MERAVQHIVSQSGGHFDPGIVAAFVRIQDEFASIAARLAD
jgi:response regulator RpfG family c-di-GMP phosphodiesterase